MLSFNFISCTVKIYLLNNRIFGKNFYTHQKGVKCSIKSFIKNCGEKVIALVVINHPLQYGGKKLGHFVHNSILKLYCEVFVSFLLLKFITNNVI